MGGFYIVYFSIVLIFIVCRRFSWLVLSFSSPFFSLITASKYFYYFLASSLSFTLDFGNLPVLVTNLKWMSV